LFGYSHHQKIYNNYEIKNFSDWRVIHFINQPLCTNHCIAEPEFSNTFVYVGKQNSIELEKKQPDTNMKTGLSKTTMGGYVSGAKSPVRIQSSDTLMFIVRVNSQSADPKMFIELHQMEVNKKKDTRALMTVKSSHGVASKTSTHIGEEGIDYRVKKYGTSSLLIYVTKLAPGEYGFSSFKGFGPFNMFGVD
jgi:hypothetical protein